MNISDVNVGIATATTVTYPWWANLVEWIPLFGQYAILFFTIIYVAFRAFNEMKKFFGKEGA